GAVPVDGNRDPVLVEAHDWEIEREADSKPIKKPVSARIARLRHTNQDIPRAGDYRLHDRDPAVVVRVVERAWIGQSVEGGFTRRCPEGCGSHRADHRAVGFIEDPVV